ncbi:hypothetical protein Tco_0255261 [Tanacetum coccineum]
MTRSTTKKFTEPLDEPEREFRRRRRAAWRQQQNESLAIAGRNLLDDEASSSTNARAKPSTPPPKKNLREHSLLAQLVSRTLSSSLLIKQETLSTHGTNEPIKSTWIRFPDLIRQVPHHGIQKWLLVQIFYDNISPEDRGKLDQFDHFYFSSLNEEEGWNRIEEFVKGAYEADECDKNKLPEQVCLSEWDIYDDPSLLRFYQNDEIPPWGNSRRKEEGEKAPE